MATVSLGLDIFRDEYWTQLKGYNIGLLSNQASLDSRLRPAKEVIAGLLPGQLKALFGPQHGFGGEEQDNMIETGHAFDRELNVPLFSLYSQVREPSPEMLDSVEILVIDLQDVGTRVYTYTSTMLGCLRAAANLGKRVIILDRPNPLGGDVIEGNLLRPEMFSFVGPYSLPMRHGLTLAEMARIFVHVFQIECDLHVVPMKGWNRRMMWQDTGLKWAMPSPNMPLPETAQGYPGQVLWEGTNVSEGRGTCRPFEIFGAPFLRTKEIIRELHREATAGCVLQEISFRPTFNKWKGKACRGFMIHLTDLALYRPYFTSVALLKAILFNHREDLVWKPPPYEYEFEKMPIDLILGDSSLRKALETGVELSEMVEEWQVGIQDFLAWRSPHLIYR